jgi:hypothetical protein
LLFPIPQHYRWPGCGLRDASAVIQRKKAVRGLKCLETRPSFRLCGDPLLGFGLALEPANVLIVAARMPCEHIPFISQLLSDYKRGRLGHWVSPLLPGFGAERISPNPRRGWLAIVAKDMHRQLTRESRTHANSPGRIARCRRISTRGICCSSPEKRDFVMEIISFGRAPCLS